MKNSLSSELVKIVSAKKFACQSRVPSRYGIIKCEFACTLDPEKSVHAPFAVGNELARAQARLPMVAVRFRFHFRFHFHWQLYAQRWNDSEVGSHVCAVCNSHGN